MASHPLLSDFNWWIFSISTFGTLILGTTLSIWLGKKLAHRFSSNHASQLTTSAQVMLALSSFLLVICYNIAENRFDQRKTLVLNEANAISTLYLRTDFLPQSQKTEAQNLIRDYLKSRLQLKTSEQIAEALEKAQQIHEALWANALAANKEIASPVLGSLYFQTLNQVIDLHAERYNRVLIYRTPLSMIYALFFSSAVSLCILSFAFGISGSKGTVTIIGPILLFSIILLLIIDLDNTKQRFFKVSQGPLIDVLHNIETN